MLYLSYKKMFTLFLNNFNIWFPNMLQQGRLAPCSCFNLQSYSRRTASTFWLIQVGARNQPTTRRCNFDFFRLGLMSSGFFEKKKKEKAKPGPQWGNKMSWYGKNLYLDVENWLMSVEYINSNYKWRNWDKEWLN